jgi:dihydroneopterin aldolase
MTASRLDGLIPAALAPRTRRIFIEDLAPSVDIGFLSTEIGVPQRLLINVEVWLDEAAFASEDDVAAAWNYDFIHSEVLRIVKGRRFNLQETLVREIYALIAGRAGVVGLRVSSRKPDIYPDCRSVGVELSSI